MSHLTSELAQLKTDIISMWKLVNSQFEKTQTALTTLDKDLAREVIAIEKRVNGTELKIDRDCENIFALFGPVAVDLRFVLAVLKINNNLERTGDIAEGIAKFIINVDQSFDRRLLDKTRFMVMYQEALTMLHEVLIAFEQEDTRMARKIFERDELLDQINIEANTITAEYIRSNPDKIEQALYLLSIIRKLERVGDQCKNMAEELIFYVEAKVLKHAAGKKAN